jgi:hypothetical protein
MARGFSQIEQISTDQIRAHPLHPRSSASNSPLPWPIWPTWFVLRHFPLPPTAFCLLPTTNMQNSTNNAAIHFRRTPAIPEPAPAAPTQNKRILQLLVGTPATPAKPQNHFEPAAVSRDPQVRRRGARSAPGRRRHSTFATPLFPPTAHRLQPPASLRYNP